MMIRARRHAGAVPPRADLAALTARCAARLAGLDLPRPFDVRELCAQVGERRGRPLVLLGMALPADAPRGLWISTAHRDYIVHENTTSVLHQEHIILHELGHVLCGHGGTGLGEEHARRLFPSLDPGTVRRIMSRSGYSSEEEQEAELLASMISRRAERNRRAPRGETPLGPSAADGLRRLESGMGHE